MSRFGDLLRLSAPAHETRFVPSSVAQYHVAVATLWNLLDRNIEQHAALCRGSGSVCPGTPFGYMRPAQLEHYASFVRNKGPLVYCKVGFNGGHGTVAMLLANAELTAHSFELGGYNYVRDAQQMVATYFGRRFVPYLGNSLVRVPELGRSPNGTLQGACDVLLVDGDHRYKGAHADLLNMRRLAKPGAVLLIDDLDEGPGPALAQAERDGVVEVIERRMFNRSTMGDADNPCLRRVRPPLWSCKAHWGWAAARYVGHATVRRSAREARGGVGGGEGGRGGKGGGYPSKIRQPARAR